MRRVDTAPDHPAILPAFSEPTCRLGMIIPSSNTVVEPVTTWLLDGHEGVTVHVSRVPVTQIDGSAAAARQFGSTVMAGAARLLADAKVDAVAWNGTAGSWLVLEHDREICRAVENVVGVPVTTGTL